MSDQNLSMTVKKPDGHHEGDFSQCPLFFLTLMSGLNKERGRKLNDQLIIYPSTSEDNTTEETSEENLDNSNEANSGSESGEYCSSEEPLGKEVWSVNDRKSFSSPGMPEPTTYDAFKHTPWIDEKLEALMEEAFPMTEEEKAKAGRGLCPSMLFQTIMKANRAQQSEESLMSPGRGIFSDTTITSTSTTAKQCPFGYGITQTTSTSLLDEKMESLSLDNKNTMSGDISKCPHLNQQKNEVKPAEAKLSNHSEGDVSKCPHSSAQKTDKK